MTPIPRIVASLPHPTALAWEISKARERIDEALFLLVPDNVWAFQLRTDLAALTPSTKSHLFPSLETDLLRNRGPSISHRTERLSYLAALTQNSSDIFIVTCEALTQRCPSLELFQNSLLLQQGNLLGRTALVSHLTHLGYLPCELVERPMEFAARGSIVDIFPVGYEHPVRVELFDDQVQSLRLFHPDSQRRLEDLEKVFIGPAREFLFPADSEGISKLRSQIRSYLDEWEWLRVDRDALLTRIEQKSYFSSIDYWAPLISPNYFLKSTCDILLPEKSHLCLVEPASIETESHLLLTAAHKGIANGRADGDWVPPSDQFLDSPENFRALLRSTFNRATSIFSLRSLPGAGFQPSEQSYSLLRSHERLSLKLQADRDHTKSDLGLHSLAEQVRLWASESTQTVFISPTPSQLERLQFLLAEYNIRFAIHSNIHAAINSKSLLSGAVASLNQGFYDPSSRLALILDEEIFGARKKRRPMPKRDRSHQAREAFSSDFSLLSLQPNDYVVHSEHGIGRYLGMRVLPFHGVPTELIEVEYKEGARLLVPVTRLNSLHRHSGAAELTPLDRLGGSTWEAKKSKVRRDLKNLAGELLHLYSKRELAKAPEIRPEQRFIDEFAASFPYVETDDQTLAIESCLSDLRGPKPMDRLVCGDVGYGKTEVALRAAHAALASGHQVAVLVPTTILAAQHEQTFRKRLEAFGYRVDGLSRFKSPREVRTTLENLAKGLVDVVVGTHKLLSSDVGFKSLGLMIVDEEQRFGVAHKERLKKLRADVHVLTLTATPIPRTLHMGLSGLKEISIISTPPQDRLSVRTHIAKRKPELIRDAVLSETQRGGQVFFLHNRIESMPKELEGLRQLLPGITIECVHGQMLETQLEERMLNFYQGKTQVLLTTSIIESGLDIPNANTLIVDRADTFGLAQLYQIRGRVGRSTQRAYAYFLIPDLHSISLEAEQRLSVLESSQELGAGFHIASHDLDLRGSGELLGGSQSGHVGHIGMDAYLELLQEAVAESRGEAVENEVDPEITLGIDTSIPETYIPEIGLRLMFYRSLAAARSEEEVDRIEAELNDRFGAPTTGVLGLLIMMRIRCQLSRLKVRSLKAGKSGCSLVFDASTPVDPQKMVDSVNRYPTLFSLSPDGKLVIRKPAEITRPEELVRSVEGALALLESWCG